MQKYGTNEELKFIAGEFFELTLPKNKSFLSKYFVLKIQRKFLKYYLTFRCIDRFVEHTGLYCSSKWLAKLRTKLETLEAKHQEAKEKMDFSMIVEIETGKYKIEE
jgi:hypothetical protein